MTRLERLEEIRKRAEKATPGPWDVRVCNRCDRLHLAGEVCEAQPNPTSADKALIDNAREDIPWLLAEVAQMKQSLETILRQATENIDPPYALFRLQAIGDEAREGLAEP